MLLVICMKKIKTFLMDNQSKLYSACCFYPFIFAGTIWGIPKLIHIFRKPSETLSLFVQYLFLTSCLISLIIALCIMLYLDNKRLDVVVSLINLVFILCISILQADPQNKLMIPLEIFMIVFVMTIGSYSVAYVVVSLLNNLGKLKISKTEIPAEWIGFLGTVIAALIGLLKK